MKGMGVRRALWLLLLSVCLPLCACGGQRQADTDWTARQIAEAIAAGQEGFDGAHWLGFDDEGFGAYLDAVYQLSQTPAEDGAIAAAGGTQAGEIAVLVLRDADSAAAAGDALAAYRESREGDFTGYVPEQAAIAAQGRVVVNGRYAALLICADPAAAQEAFLGCFDGTPPPWDPAPAEPSGTEPPADPSAAEPSGGKPPADPSAAEPSGGESPANPSAAEPPGGESPADPSAAEPSGGEPPADPSAAEPSGGEPPADPSAAEPPSGEPPANPSAAEPPEGPSTTEPPAQDAYDAGAVLAAWRSGDSSALSPKNRAILEACGQVIGDVVTEDMTGYERELAIHDWMTGWAEYDPGALDRFGTPNPDNDNPYGFLVGRVGICLGYTRTFQLFMDMLDVECVTVEGRAHGGREDHAWNMVRLDGEWYCVDVTWDDSVGHVYFNVTSEFLRRNDHQWDETAVEEATGTKYAWGA